MPKRVADVVYPVPISINRALWTRVRRNVLSERECTALLQVLRGLREHRPFLHTLDRAVTISYLYPKHAPWAFKKIARVIAEENIWRLALTGIAHPIRIQRYNKGGYTGPHSDVDFTTSDHSKITAVVPLVRRHSWTGGCLLVGSTGATPAVDRGDCILFPSFAVHEVTRVTRGERIVLTAWASGPPLV